MDASKRVTRVSKTKRYLDWSQHRRFRCTSFKEALEFEDRLSPVARYVDNVSANKSSNRVRTLAKIMGTTARVAQRRLHCFRWRSM